MTSTSRAEAFEKAVDQCNEIAGPGDQSRRLFDLGIAQGRREVVEVMEGAIDELENDGTSWRRELGITFIDSEKLLAKLKGEGV